MFQIPAMKAYGQSSETPKLMPFDIGQLEAYGSAPGAGQRALLKTPRRRLNSVAIGLSLVLPWLMFVVMNAVTAFYIRYETPGATWFIVALGFLLILAVGIYAFCYRERRRASDAHQHHQPTWLIVFVVTSLIAWVLGTAMGSSNYSANFKPNYDLMNLNSYTDVNPSAMRAQQLMDAGRVEFAEGSRLDVTKSMGFKNVNVYCVAPITLGNASVGTHDFWAVGVNCCSGNQADFHCDDNSHHLSRRGGLRLMSDGDRPFYRLAVQQAESMYHIKANHPIFFHWVDDPLQVAQASHQRGMNRFHLEISGYLIFQAIAIVATTLCFAKLEQS